MPKYIQVLIRTSPEIKAELDKLPNMNQFINSVLAAALFVDPKAAIEDIRAKLAIIEQEK